MQVRQLLDGSAGRGPIAVERRPGAGQDRVIGPAKELPLLVGRLVQAGAVRGRGIVDHDEVSPVGRGVDEAPLRRDDIFAAAPQEIRNHLRWLPIGVATEIDSG